MRRWLTRPSRVPRSVRGAAATVLGALAIVGLAAAPSDGQTGAADRRRPAERPCERSRKVARAAGIGQPDEVVSELAGADRRGAATSTGGLLLVPRHRPCAAARMWRHR